MSPAEQSGSMGILIYNTDFDAIEISIAVPISGIQCLFDLRIRDGKKPDPGWKKTGSGMEKFVSGIPG